MICLVDWMNAARPSTKQACLPFALVSAAALLLAQSPWYRRRPCSLRNPAVFGRFQPLLLANLHNHFANGLEHCVRVDRVIAVFYDDLTSTSGEPGKLRLELMDPDFVKSH